jgi:hypothetical protein
MKKTPISVLLILASFSATAQNKVFTLQDWNIKDYDSNQELRLNVSEFKLNFNHPLAYADMQKEWKVQAELKCGTLGTEQVFVCKEGKGSHLIGKNSLAGDIQLGYDNMTKQFFVDVIDKYEEAHRLCAGPKVNKDQWYAVKAESQYNPDKDESVIKLTIDGQTSSMRYPGNALRHNASLWVIGHGFLVDIPMHCKSGREPSATLKSAVHLCPGLKDRILCSRIVLRQTRLLPS